ncbi:MAG: SPASM domain-containing protein [Spirochaetia bacterium]
MEKKSARETFVWNKTRISYPADEYPESLYIELSSRCNFSCKGCFREGFQETFGDMDDEILKSILSFLDRDEAKGRVRRVIIGGVGEPLLHPRFTWFFQQLSGLVPAIEVQTNGSFLDKGMIDFLVETGLDKLILSYETGALGHAAGSNLEDAAVPAGDSETISGLGSGDFPGNAFLWKVIERMKDARIRAGKRRPLIALEWVLTRESLEDLEAFGGAVVAAKAEEIIISNILPIDEEGEKEILYRTDGCREGKGELLETLFRSIRHRVHYTVPQFSLRTERYCSFVEKKSAVIRWDGEVAPCYRFLHDGTERVDGKDMELISHSFGNIDKQSLYDIWNSREYIWFRISVSQSLYPSCTDCTLKAGCEYLRDSSGNCWGIEPSCGNCLWSRQIILCP